MQVDVGAVALHGDELEVAAEVARVQARDGQAVAEAGHGGLEVRFVEVRVEVGGLVDGRVHVGPDEGDAGAGDSAAFVGDFDRDVLAAFADNDLRDGEFLLVGAVGFDDGAQAVLKGFEEHVRQVAGHVHEVEIGRANKTDLGRVEEAVVVLADEAGVFDCLLRQVAHVGVRADDADVVGIRVRALICQGDVLADKHADTYTAHVEAVEEGLDVVVYLHTLPLALVFQNSLCDGRHDRIVSSFDLLQKPGEFVVVIGQLWGPAPTVFRNAAVVFPQAVHS